MASVCPLDEEFGTKVDVEKIDFDQVNYLCLNCYAEIIRVRGQKAIQRGERLMSADSAIKSVSGLETVAKTPITTKQTPPTSSVQHRTVLDKILSKTGKTNRPLTKSSRPRPYKQTVHRFNPIVSSANSVEFYDMIKSRAAAGQETRKQRTDISHYANAMYNGGVFKQAQQGTSL